MIIQCCTKIRIKILCVYYVRSLNICEKNIYSYVMEKSRKNKGEKKVKINVKYTKNEDLIDTRY